MANRKNTAKPLSRLARDPALRAFFTRSRPEAGDAFAVPSVKTRNTADAAALLAAYARWLELELRLLRDEMQPTPPNFNMIDALKRGFGEERIAALEKDPKFIHSVRELEKSRITQWNEMNIISDGTPFIAARESKVDDFFVDERLSLKVMPASARAALVLAAVGCEWKEPRR